MWTHQDSLTAALVAITAYYAWEARQTRILLADEREGHEAERQKEAQAEDYRSETARMTLAALQISLNSKLDTLGRIRAVEGWMSHSLDRFLQNAPALKQLSPQDLAAIQSLLRAMHAISELVLSGNGGSEIEIKWLEAEWRLKNYLIEKVGDVVRGSNPQANPST